jgi:hypothetical protein
MFILVVCGGFILSLPITIQAETEQQSNGPVCPPEKQKNQPSKNFKVTSFEISEDKVVYLFPQGDLYPFNIADPNRVGLSFQFQEYTETEIPDVGDTRFYLKAGGNIGIFRVANKSEPDHGWQLNLIGGFDAMFDIDGSLDNIGWDGNYGVILTIDQDTDFLYKFGLMHTSSHLGDEYIEETGRTRIGYTRQELLLGVSRLLTKYWRVYGEGGWGFDVGNPDLMEPWRVKGGLEFVGEEKVWKDRASWYAAIDIQSWEESDWGFDVSSQVGMEINSGGRRARVGIEYYEGRVPIGEFFQYYENYISFGIWMDI